MFGQTDWPLDEAKRIRNKIQSNSWPRWRYWMNTVNACERLFFLHESSRLFIRFCPLFHRAVELYTSGPLFSTWSETERVWKIVKVSSWIIYLSESICPNPRAPSVEVTDSVHYDTRPGSWRWRTSRWRWAHRPQYVDLYRNIPDLNWHQLQ